MTALSHLVRRWWLGLVPVLLFAFVFLAMISSNPNSGSSTASLERTRSERETVLPANDRSRPSASDQAFTAVRTELISEASHRSYSPASVDELAVGRGEAALTLAPPRISGPARPDGWLGHETRKVPDVQWGKYTISLGTPSYPNPWTQVTHLFGRLRSQYTGLRLPVGSRLPLDAVITLHVIEQVRQPRTFTTYYSPGLNGASTSIKPITKTNSGQISSIPVPLHVLLASNGFSVIRLKPDVIKVFPTSMAHVYSNVPINPE